MRTLDDALNQFAYHPATEDTAPRHAALRDETIAFAQRTWELIPDGPEKTLAYRGLQQFLMQANLALALTAPADRGETRAVPRVLPERQ
jgi:hypothetical protein